MSESSCSERASSARARTLPRTRRSAARTESPSRRIRTASRSLRRASRRVTSERRGRAIGRPPDRRPTNGSAPGNRPGGATRDKMRASGPPGPVDPGPDQPRRTGPEDGSPYEVRETTLDERTDGARPCTRGARSASERSTDPARSPLLLPVLLPALLPDLRPSLACHSARAMGPSRSALEQGRRTSERVLHRRRRRAAPAAGGSR